MDKFINTGILLNPYNWGLVAFSMALFFAVLFFLQPDKQGAS